MAFTTTINYIQNVPVSFGLTNYINPVPARNVTATFIFESPVVGGINYATVIIPEVPGVTIKSGLSVVNSSGGRQFSLTGDVAAVNLALNQAMFQTLAYSTDELQQDVLSLDRALGNYKGEMQIQVPPGTDMTGLTVGSVVTFSSIPNAVNNLYRFSITKIDATNSPIRLWMIYQRDYTISDLVADSSYKKVNINKNTSQPCYLQTISGTTFTNIGPVIDLSFGNGQGTLSLTFQVVDGATETNTFIMVGSPQIAEPSFPTLPPLVANASATNTWNILPQMGTVAQADQNYLDVQMLIKVLPNDPMYLGVTSYTLLPNYPVSGTEIEKQQFVGDLIDTKSRLAIPVYILDKSYGIFADGQIERRASVSYPNTPQEVRWVFFGTPVECNNELGQVQLWRANGFNKTFYWRLELLLRNLEYMQQEEKHEHTY